MWLQKTECIPPDYVYLIVILLENYFHEKDILDNIPKLFKSSQRYTIFLYGLFVDFYNTVNKVHQRGIKHNQDHKNV